MLDQRDKGWGMGSEVPVQKAFAKKIVEVGGWGVEKFISGALEKFLLVLVVLYMFSCVIDVLS